MKRILLLLIFGIGMGLMGWGQSYLGLDGGLEGSATIDNSTATSSPQTGKWTRTDANLNIANETSLVRSGSNSLKISMTSTSLKRVWTPLFTISSTTSKFYVQYYRRSASTTNTQTQQPGVVRGGTEQASGSYTMVSAADTWEKVTYAPTSITAATSVAGVILTKANASGGDVFIDDFCIYAATAVDNTPPDVPTAGSPTVAVTSSTSLTVSWMAPATGVDNGGYLVVRGTSDPTTAPNVNGIYAVNNIVATGMTVVYRGTGTSFLDGSLSPGTQYFYRIYTYDKAYNYSTALTGNGTTSSSLSTEPTNHPTLFSATANSQTSITTTWNDNDGAQAASGFLIFASTTNSFTDPVDGTTQSDETDLSDGAAKVNVAHAVQTYTWNSGLSAGTTYYFKIFPYNGTGTSINYKTDGTVPTANATTNSPTNNSDSKVESPASQISAGNLASTATGIGSAVSVFSFKIHDLGTSDGLATKVTQVTIKKSSGTADWSDHIAGASLWDGGSQITTGTVVITDADITFPITSPNLDISDGSSKDITLKIWLNTTNIVDNATMVFTVSQTSHGFTADATGSTFASDFGAAVTGNTMTISVTATKLLFTTAPSTTACPNTNLSTPPVVTAKDANNNTDTDFTGQVTLTNSGSIGMTGYQVTNATAGVATFTNLQFTETGNVTLSTTNTSGLTNDGPTASIAISVSNVTATGATNGNTQSVVSWTNPSCYDEIMIVAKAGSTVAATPSGDGSAYTGNLAFGTGTPYDGGYVVYEGSTSSQTVTGLTNGTTYYFTFFTRKGSSWSTGVTSTANPAINTDYFRSKASGNWNVAGTWESSADGSTGWATATLTPAANNTVYIQSGHTVTLTQNEACKDLHISTGTTSPTTGSEGIVALASYTLEINGKLRCFYATVGTVPGTTTNSIGTGPITITASSAGKIKFVGLSRNIVNTGEWAAANTGSTTTFAVEIAMTAGQTATMQTSIKASSWIISSGTLDAGVNRIAADIGAATGSDVTINSGTTLISSATGTGTSAVVGRTSGGLGGILTLNGSLILSGAAPTIGMTTINFNGLVEYNAEGVQVLATSINSGGSPSTYTNLKLNGTSAKTLGVNTTVNGTLTMAGTTASLALGGFTLTYGSSSTLEYSGSTSQTTANTEFPASPTVGPKNLNINNSNGATLNSDKVINGTLTVKPSAVFDASTFVVSGTGDFDVQAGATIKSAHASGLDGNNTTSGGASSYSSSANYEFAGTSAQVTGSYLPSTLTGNLTFSNTTGVTPSTNYTINTPSVFTVSGVVNFGSASVSGTGSFTLSSGATIKTANTSGINGSIAISGTPTLSTGANYEFNGSSAQVTGTLLPATVNNFTIDNAAGVKLSNAALTVTGTMLINTGKLFTLESTKQLTVDGTLTNSATATGLVIESNSSGTGSLKHVTASVPAIVNRYFTGAAESWHLLSSPVASQAISGDFIPSGSYGDGTGYDFYTWYEPASLWVNFKNTTSAPTWNTANGGTSFVVGRGYMVAYQAANPTKTFTGNLSQGTINIPLSYSGTGTYQYSNLVGNPYPSSIDWKASTGWTRSSLSQNAGGYDIHIYNQSFANYGAYNSASLSDDGTNGATRYISPMQGFSVKASGAGNLTMTDDVRVHSGQAFLKSTEELADYLNLTVTSSENTYSDQAIIEFNHDSDEGGASKMFSFVAEAPSLYTTKADSFYSIDFRGAAEGATVIPLNFKAGVNGNFTITASDLETFAAGVIINIEDVKTGQIQNLMENPVYSFVASKDDAAARFKLHFGGTFAVNDLQGIDKVRIYAYENSVYLTTTTPQDANISVFNITGQEVYSARTRLDGMKQFGLNVPQGWYVVRVVCDEGIKSEKIFIR